MLMTHEETLTPLALVILNALRSTGGAWLTRLEIAQRIGRPNRATPLDIDILNQLVRMGLIEVQQHSRGVVQVEYVYRAIPPDK
jgi:predicted transcriptional regulator